MTTILRNASRRFHSGTESDKLASMPNIFKAFRVNLREFGLRETAASSAVWITRRLLASAFHKKDCPSLAALFSPGLSVHFSATDFIRDHIWQEENEIPVNQLRTEYDQLCRQLEERYSTGAWTYPRSSAVEESSSFLLYGLIRLIRPLSVLETGVANGHSSFLIVRALLANGHGVLHSVDLDANAGGLLAESERKIWQLHVLDSLNLRESLRSVVNSLPGIDLFLHDSDHTYRWQTLELDLAYANLRPHGIVIADDADASYAFLDFCRRRGLRPAFLVEKRKAFGVALTRVPPALHV